MLSLIPSAEPLPQDITVTQTPVINSGFAAVDQVVNPVISESLAPRVEHSVNPMQVVLGVAANVWVIGIALMLLYALFSYLRLAHKVRPSVRCRENIYYCDNIDTPFILGVFRPRIYLPSGMREEQMDYVIQHEKAHLKRGDHLWKPLGFVLLAVYWFHPLLWIAYVLLCRDIETACDEKVIKDMDNAAKRGYAETLVACSVHRRMILVCPLAFGEVSVKNRIKSVLYYKKPTVWIILVAVVASIVVAVCFLTNPKQDTKEPLESETESTKESTEESTSSVSGLFAGKVLQIATTHRHDSVSGITTYDYYDIRLFDGAELTTYCEECFVTFSIRNIGDEGVQIEFSEPLVSHGWTSSPPLEGMDGLLEYFIETSKMLLQPDEEKEIYATLSNPKTEYVFSIVDRTAMRDTYGQSFDDLFYSELGGWGDYFYVVITEYGYRGDTPGIGIRINQIREENGEIYADVLWKNQSQEDFALSSEISYYRWQNDGWIITSHHPNEGASTIIEKDSEYEHSYKLTSSPDSNGFLGAFCKDYRLEGDGAWIKFRVFSTSGPPIISDTIVYDIDGDGRDERCELVLQTGAPILFVYDVESGLFEYGKCYSDVFVLSNFVKDEESGRVYVGGLTSSGDYQIYHICVVGGEVVFVPKETS